MFAPFRQLSSNIIIIICLVILLVGGIIFLIYFYSQSKARKITIENASALNVELDRKVHERTAELERTVAELQAANKNLEAFSYSVSHDLRAPLRGIDGFSQALLEDCYDSLDEEGREYLKRIRAAAQKMAELIDDLLQLSRVTLSPLNKVPANLSQLALKIGDELRRAAPEMPVEFVVAPEIMAEGDPKLLRIVLYNLLSNAWKFSSKCRHPRVEFKTEKQGNEQAYCICDNGVGFDMTYIDKLFKPFQRLHSASEYPGTGIGLAIVERIIRRHGGSVGAESAPGIETKFYFTL
jgi:light-regulated signal transduction histidine kinase (bacteriophytochrome)